MNTSLGINFFRTVNEQGSDGWAQVYARVPFDDYELMDKGALFGVLGGKPDEKWAEMESEIMLWVDEFYNKCENGGVLAEFGVAFRDKYEEAESAWVWVVPKNNGEREVRVLASGKSKVELVRGGVRFNLAAEQNKAVRGKLQKGDKLIMLYGGLCDLAGEVSETDENTVLGFGGKMKEADVSGAGLFFEIGDAIEEKPAETEVIKEDLATDVLVGKLSFKDRLINRWNRAGEPKLGRVTVNPEKEAKRKRLAMFLGVVFLVLLGVSLVSGTMKIRSQAEEKRWSEFASPLEKNMADAVDLMKINPNGAKKLLEEVRATFDLRKAEFATGKQKDKVSELEKKIGDAWVVVSGERSAVFEEKVDLSLTREGLIGERMSRVGAGKVLVVDTKMGAAVSADLESKSVKVVLGKGEGLGWIDGASDGTKTYILKQKGVTADEKEVIVFDLAVSNPVALGRFGSSLYVLDAGNREIYKYGAVDGGFGERVRWLGQGVSVSGVSVVDMAIDSDVWVLAADGKVERYRRGARENFSLMGLPLETKAFRLAVWGEGVKLAILDRQAGVISVCDKESGVCSAQLKQESLKSASDIEFDENGNLLVLMGGKIGVLK